MKRPNPKDVNPYDSKARMRTRSFMERYTRFSKFRWKSKEEQP